MDAYRQKQMQAAAALFYQHGEFSESKENTSFLGIGKENGINRKRKMFSGPPKPDTPPVSVMISIFSYVLSVWE